MRRFALVLVAGLVFVGVALADAPTSVTVSLGTLLHGDAASLAATDGDTLDIRTEKKGGAPARPWVLRLKAQYGERPAGTLTVRYSYWSEPVPANTCYFWMTLNRTRIGPFAGEHDGPAEHMGQFQATAPNPGKLVVRAVCTNRPTQIVLHFDLLTLDESP